MRIVIKNLSFTYRSGRKIFENLNVVLPGGQIVAITGMNGTGKTTLLKLIAGILNPGSGEIVFEGFKSNPPIFGFVFQNPSEQFVHFTVEREIAFGLENMGYGNDVIKTRVDEVLRRFDLYGRRGVSPDELSGGEQQRLSIASSVAYKPEVFLMDEPVSYLDEPGRRLFFEMVDSLRREGYSILWVAQEPSELSFADCVVLLERGKAIVFDSVEEFLENEYDIV